ncbi:hypothetical protein FZC84_12060 [Rossellomorea vietnamensis]|uniref:Uncharacterized protein n=1 Tax=Rossellomorea vietnamensis TaxID=218284 RepID=A0A5D4MBK4_9BACI|nr:hypothetical protein [Rossellomorea vietnamensis]TYR99102.1 hypothetical protein FZC84_12060 [Rossellomorea vietnamensis]
MSKYMEQDQETSLQEKMCAMDLLVRTALAIHFDDVKGAKEILSDINKSLNSIEKMQARKENYDQLQQVATNLAKKGLLVSIVTRRLD